MGGLRVREECDHHPLRHTRICYKCIYTYNTKKIILTTKLYIEFYSKMIIQSHIEATILWNVCIHTTIEWLKKSSANMLAVLSNISTLCSEFF